MSFRDILRVSLRADEGVKPFPYRDTTGHLTIGCGRNLDAVGLRPDEVTYLLENDIRAAELVARALVPSFERLTEARKAVVCNMAFNMGGEVLGTFRGTLRAIAEERWDDAAQGMLASKWARQVGARAVRLAAEMRRG